MLTPTQILVPTDFSAFSDKALQQALDIAKEYGSRVHVLHVVHEKLGHSIDDYELSAQSIKRVETKMVKGAQKRLERQITKFAEATGLEVSREVIIGNPSEAILRTQKEKGADLIIISSLGATGLGKYFIGSVARNVLKGSTCPVLLTK